MNITGSWPMDTEMANRSLGLAGQLSNPLLLLLVAHQSVKALQILMK